MSDSIENNKDKIPPELESILSKVKNSELYLPLEKYANLDPSTQQKNLEDIVDTIIKANNKQRDANEDQIIKAKMLQDMFESISSISKNEKVKFKGPINNAKIKVPLAHVQNLDGYNVSSKKIGDDEMSEINWQEKLFDQILEGQKREHQELIEHRKEIQELRKESTAAISQISEKIDSVKEGLQDKIESFKVDLQDKIDSVKTEMHVELSEMRTRMDEQQKGYRALTITTIIAIAALVLPTVASFIVFLLSQKP